MPFDGTATATATATVTTTGEGGRPPAFMWLGPSASMDITNILNRKGSAAAAAMAAAAAAAAVNHDQHLQHQLAHHVVARSPSESGSERAPSSYGSERSHYSARTAHALHAMATLPTDLRYSPTAMQAPMPNFPSGMIPSGPYEQNIVPSDHTGSIPPPLASPTPKAFPCSSCGKGFARRSDLARHERIHTGVRPHVCDFPGCNKQFIQRSALTVHARVHTGEKPHMCERCGKPFSDSSSLARHRRIHSGKRPYKCPYADCQKTFTRRTTLTRHQNHHTGTVEEAAAATAAALASRPPVGRTGRPTRSDGGEYSHTGSPLSTPSPGPRTMSLSPSAPLPGIPSMPRHHSDFAYMSAGSLPPHLRSDMRPPSPRSSPATTPTHPHHPHHQHHHHLMSMGGRPTINTSHPASYGPPPVLEPPANLEHQQHQQQHQQHQQQQRPGSGSTGGSPHMSAAVGWQSPTHMVGGMMSPAQATHDGYGYADQYGQAAAAAALVSTPLYYPNSNMRRPQSAEAHMDGYDMKGRGGGDVWTTSVS
ncbi:MAG: hypothetical protein M1823_000877 [Watsoniomyces obsoletus]|nr:MAG: hypothetical protein M1823_000877 [Watsoniomyces obsoletus]